MPRSSWHLSWAGTRNGDAACSWASSSLLASGSGYASQATTSRLTRQYELRPCFSPPSCVPVSPPEPAHVAAREPADETPGRWVDARDLRVGDLLLRRTGELARVQGIGIRDARMAVYNLRVAELHNYAVGEGQILAHNPTDCDTAAARALAK